MCGASWEFVQELSASYLVFQHSKESKVLSAASFDDEFHYSSFVAALVYCQSDGRSGIKCSLVLRGEGYNLNCHRKLTCCHLRPKQKGWVEQGGKKRRHHLNKQKLTSNRAKRDSLYSMSCFLLLSEPRGIRRKKRTFAV